MMGGEEEQPPEGGAEGPEGMGGPEAPPEGGPEGAPPLAGGPEGQPPTAGSGAPLAKPNEEDIKKFNLDIDDSDREMDEEEIDYSELDE